MTKHVEQLALRDFDTLLRIRSLASDPDHMGQLASQDGGARVQAIIKAPVGALTTGSGGITGDERSLQTQFFNSLRARGVYDRMLADMRTVPFNSRSAMITQAAVASAGQGQEGRNLGANKGRAALRRHGVFLPPVRR